MSPAHDDRPALLKLSGESLSGEGKTGIDPERLRETAGQVAEALAAAPTGLAVVPGGGNLLRGATIAAAGLAPRATADHMGMLATVINGLALRDALRAAGAPATLLSGAGVRGIAEEFTRERGRELLDADHVVVLAGGTGSPFFSTDTGAALRAAELGCGTILKATKVDGVYDADPKSNPDAQRFDRLTIDEAIRRELRVLDLSALDMCRAHGIDVIVFDFAVGGAAARAIRGEAVGTRIETA